MEFCTMSTYKENQAKVAEARKSRDTAESILFKNYNRLRSYEVKLENLKRNARTYEADVLQAKIEQLKTQLAQDHDAFVQSRLKATEALATLVRLADPQKLVEELDDSIPFLLLPIRIETRFMTVKEHRELWVRFFPDDIAIDTHEETLTEDEVGAGKTYWKEILKAEGDRDEEKGAWRALAEGYGSQRAAWIAIQMKPTNWSDHPSGRCALEELTFPAHVDTKEYSWSRAPRSRVMPDRFVVMAFVGKKMVYEKIGNAIPDPLIVGPEPIQFEEGFKQEDGELEVDSEMEWMVDFPKAVANGMGVRMRLEPPYDTRGFDRLLVLGLCLSTDEIRNQELLEELIAGQHYTDEGFSLVPQGTPTNNTEASGSGYSSIDPGEETSFLVETGGALFTEESDHFKKSDGQRLAEALGIRYETLQYINHSDTSDVAEAMAMNKALWPATLAYFMQEMMDPVFKPSEISDTRNFFTNYVTGRGLLPAIRVGKQPYGILPTSVFSRWKNSREHDGSDFIYLNKLHSVLLKMEQIWEGLVSDVPHAGGSGDPFDNLLNMLGLHASSVEYYRRDAAGSEYFWNYLNFIYTSFFAFNWREVLKYSATQLLNELGYDFKETPRIFEISFFNAHTRLDGPLIDDSPLSEVNRIKPFHESVEKNYIDWLINSTVAEIKTEKFRDTDGNKVAAPKALLYLALRHALLREYFDTAMQIYQNREVVSREAHKEKELLNVGEQRDITPWEYLEVDVQKVLPNLVTNSITMGDYLRTDASSALSETSRLQDIRSAFAKLVDLPTARLERLFAEHLDLCSYRLDAWQMGLFHCRLQSQRLRPSDNDYGPKLKRGIYMGAFGWLEDLRPAAPREPVEFGEIPKKLREPEKGLITEAPGSGGYIHGPSLTHAVTAAVLRNAYLTHADSDKAETMTVNLSSERVRTALSFLEGIRNGQELAALLGYQFERGLHDRYPNLNVDKYIYPIRKKYPLVGDKITESEDNEPIEAIEARNVVDGLALVEAARLKEGETGSKFPYGVDYLSTASSEEKAAIESEIDCMADSLDAIGDLALAESVFQVAQGNYDRAGAILKAFTEGSNPPEPEIVKTPRSGTAMTNRVTLHFETGLDPSDPTINPWLPVAMTPRAKAEPGLNKWLAAILGDPRNIRCQVYFTNPCPTGPNEDEVSLGDLKIQPLDFVLIAGDELAGEATELEKRIDYVIRKKYFINGDDTVSIRFMERPNAWGTDVKTFFEILPLAKRLREVMTGCRHLTADDFLVPSEEDTTEVPNPKGYDLEDLKGRVKDAYDKLVIAKGELKDKKEAITEPFTDDTFNKLRAALITVANFGVSEAFPESAFGASAELKEILVGQAERVLAILEKKWKEALELRKSGDDAALTTEQRVAKYIEAAKTIFDGYFNVLPIFNLRNTPEVTAAFRGGQGMIPASKPLIVEEWMQGLSRIRPKMGAIEEILTLNEAFNDAAYDLKLTPIQLPFWEENHWIAVDFPEGLTIPGDVLSIVMQSPTISDFSKGQAGLLIDDWTEVIPNKQEITGIAVHYDQPNSEPPQTLLLAITPEITGKWKWADLVDTLHETLDRAKRRAVEPDQLGKTAYAHLLPATLTAVTRYLVAIATDFVANVGLHERINPNPNGDDDD